MRKIITRFTAMALSAAVTFTMFPTMADAATMSELMPVAGVARALNEGKSVTVVKADIIKKPVPFYKIKGLSKTGNAGISRFFEAYK